VLGCIIGAPNIEHSTLSYLNIAIPFGPQSTWAAIAGFDIIAATGFTVNGSMVNIWHNCTQVHADRELKCNCQLYISLHFSTETMTAID
jgi:hypothetical protein